MQGMNNRLPNVPMLEKNRVPRVWGPDPVVRQHSPPDAVKDQESFLKARSSAGCCLAWIQIYLAAPLFLFLSFSTLFSLEQLIAKLSVLLVSVETVVELGWFMLQEFPVATVPKYYHHPTAMHLTWSLQYRLIFSKLHWNFGFWGTSRWHSQRSSKHYLSLTGHKHNCFKNRSFLLLRYTSKGRRYTVTSTVIFSQILLYQFFLLISV